MQLIVIFVQFSLRSANNVASGVLTLVSSTLTLGDNNTTNNSVALIR
jgi:hypothetical protein